MHRLHDGASDIGFTGWFLDWPRGGFTVGLESKSGILSGLAEQAKIRPERRLIGWVWNDMTDPTAVVTHAGEDVPFSALIQGF